MPCAIVIKNAMLDLFPSSKKDYKKGTSVRSKTLLTSFTPFPGPFFLVAFPSHRRRRNMKRCARPAHLGNVFQIPLPFLQFRQRIWMVKGKKQPAAHSLRQTVFQWAQHSTKTNTSERFKSHAVDGRNPSANLRWRCNCCYAANLYIALYWT